MSSFYKRRRGILEHLEAGTISLLDLAVHDYLNLKANLFIGGNSSIPPGICKTSAVAIHATCPGGISEKAVQRSLKHLERIGWIKRWNVRGKHGNYPVLICRASVHDASGNEYRVSGEQTMNWRQPKLVLVSESSADREFAVQQVSIYRDKRGERGEKNPPAKPAPPADPRFQPFKDFAFEAFEQKHGQKPTWKGRDFKALALVLSSNKGLCAGELERRFQNYLDSTEAFTQKQGGSLAYFCDHVDSFLNGPILEPRKVAAHGKQTGSDLAIQNARALGLGRPN